MSTEDDGTTPAPDGQIWVCGACGKTSKTRYGFDIDGIQVSSKGWDSSCTYNATLRRLGTLPRRK